MIYYTELQTVMAEQKNNNTDYEKAVLLMEDALKKYSEGRFDEAEKSREQANKLFDKAKVQILGYDNDALYGESRNFGLIYKTIESNAPSMFENKKKNRDLAKIIKAINEDSTLKQEFKIYNMLAYPKNASNAEAYVNEAVDMIKALPKKNVLESNNNLISLIRSLNLNEMVDISEEDENLCEAIEFLTLNKKNLSNINEYIEAKKTVMGHVSNNLVAESVDAEEKYKKGVDELEKQYNESLNDDEKAFIDEIAKSDDKEKMFNEAKERVLSEIKGKLNECDGNSRESLNEVISDIESRVYSESTVISNLSEFEEIINTINQ